MAGDAVDGPGTAGREERVAGVRGGEEAVDLEEDAAGAWLEFVLLDDDLPAAHDRDFDDIRSVDGPGVGDGFECDEASYVGGGFAHGAQGAALLSLRTHCVERISVSQVRRLLR